MCLLSQLPVLNTAASYPGLPMFVNVPEKSLVDFGDVVDVVCDDAQWNE